MTISEFLGKLAEERLDREKKVGDSSLWQPFKEKLLDRFRSEVATFNAVSKFTDLAINILDGIYKNISDPFPLYPVFAEIQTILQKLAVLATNTIILDKEVIQPALKQVPVPVSA